MQQGSNRVDVWARVFSVSLIPAHMMPFQCKLLDIVRATAMVIKCILQKGILGAFHVDFENVKRPMRMPKLFSNGRQRLDRNSEVLLVIVEHFAIIWVAVVGRAVQIVGRKLHNADLIPVILIKLQVSIHATGAIVVKMIIGELSEPFRRVTVPPLGRGR